LSLCRGCNEVKQKQQKQATINAAQKTLLNTYRAVPLSQLLQYIDLHTDVHWTCSTTPLVSEQLYCTETQTFQLHSNYCDNKYVHGKTICRW